MNELLSFRGLSTWLACQFFYTAYSYSKYVVFEYFSNSKLVPTVKTVLAYPFFYTGAAVLVTAITGGVCFWYYITRINQNKNKTPEQTASQLPEADGSFIYDEIKIFFGSQTGTAESFAHELGKLIRSRRYFKQTNVIDLEDFDGDQFTRTEYVVFVVATYGEGEPTDNAVDAIKWLCSKDREKDCLKTMKFAVFGLGNSQYSLFNETGKRVYRTLEKLGGVPLCFRGEGDDDKDIEVAFHSWKEIFIQSVSDLCEGKNATNPYSNEEVDDSNLLSSYNSTNLNIIAKDFSHTAKIFGKDGFNKMCKRLCICPVLRAHELRKEVDYGSGLTTVQIDFDITNLRNDLYETTDTVEVLPRNDLDTVDWFFNRLGFHQHGFKKSDYIVATEPKLEDMDTPFPVPCTIQDALELYTDLCLLPHKLVLKGLATYVKNKQDAAVLQIILSDSWGTHYQEYIRGLHLSLKEFFEIFLNNADFFDPLSALKILCRQKLRSYTGASSSKMRKGVVSIILSRLYEERPALDPLFNFLQENGLIPNYCNEIWNSRAARPLYGLCSSYLTSFLNNENFDSTLANIRKSYDNSQGLCLFVKRSSFRIPKPLFETAGSNPKVVMICTGTGIAPFIGILDEFFGLRLHNRAIVFFGCRNSNQDFIYGDYLRSLHNSTPPFISNLICAFSRETEQKTYVQHKIIENSEFLWNLISDGAYIFVCGGLHMGHDVAEALRKICVGRSDLPTDGDMIKYLKSEKRYFEELWS